MKKILISRNESKRLEFIKSIPGKKIAIYNKYNPLLDEFDECIDMSKLMKQEYFLEKILLCDSNTTLVLIDVLVKNGIYVHPYGKIFRFTEAAKETLIIDDFLFRYTERGIVRPFLFVDTSVFGTSMLAFHADESNTVESYVELIRPYIDCQVEEIECEIINYTPTEDEKNGYEKLKNELIIEKKVSKGKLVSELFSYINSMESKKKAFLENSDKYGNSFVVTSNEPKMKFKIYDVLKDENVRKIYFFSSGFGIEKLELNHTKTAIERHNTLIKLLKNEKI